MENMGVLEFLQCGGEFFEVRVFQHHFGIEFKSVVCVEHLPTEYGAEGLALLGYGGRRTLF